MVRSGVDVSVAISADATTVYVADNVELTIDVTANGRHTAHGATLHMSLAGIEFVSMAAGSNTCNVQLGVDIQCQLEDLAPGDHTRVVIRTRARFTGDWKQDVFATVPGDGDSVNNFASVNLLVSPEDYVGATPDDNDIQAVVGAPYDLAFTLKAGGRRISNNVRFEIGEPTMGELSVLTLSAGTCVKNPPSSPGGRASIRCDFGNLNPGDQRTFVLRLQVNTAGFDTIVHSTSSNTASFSNTVAIRSGAGIDVSVEMSSLNNAAEGQSGNVDMTVGSKGLFDPQNLVTVVDVAAPLRMTAINSPGWTCELQSAQRARCTRATLTDDRSFLNFTYVADTAGTYLVTTTVTADGDVIPDNNAASLRTSSFGHSWMSAFQRRPMRATSWPELPST